MGKKDLSLLSSRNHIINKGLCQWPRDQGDQAYQSVWCNCWNSFCFVDTTTVAIRITQPIPLLIPLEQTLFGRCLLESIPSWWSILKRCYDQALFGRCLLENIPTWWCILKRGYDFSHSVYVSGSRAWGPLWRLEILKRENFLPYTQKWL